MMSSSILALWSLTFGAVSVGGDTLVLSLQDIPTWAQRSVWSQMTKVQTDIQRGLAIQAWSALWPQIFFTGNYQYSSYVQKFTQRVIVGFNPETGMPIFKEVPIEFGKHHTYTLSMGFQYPIWTWGRFRFLAQAQQEQVRASQVNQDQTVKNLTYSAQQVYINLLVLQESQHLLDDMEQTLHRHYEATRERYAQGLASDLDLLQAEVNWRNIQPQKEQVRAQYHTLVNTLRNLLDLPDQPIRLADTLTAAVPPVPDTFKLFHKLEDRADLVALTHQIRAAEHLLAAAKTEDKPTVSLQAAYTLRNPIGFEKEWGTLGTITVGLNVPLFDGFRSRGKVLQMEATLRSLRLLRQKTIKEAKRKIRSLLQDLASLHTQIQAQQDNLTLAEKLLKTAEQQYDLGLISQLEYLNASNGYLQAKVQYLQAIAAYRSKLLDLQKAVEVGSSIATKGSEASSDFSSQEVAISRSAFMTESSSQGQAGTMKR